MGVTPSFDIAFHETLHIVEKEGRGYFKGLF